MNARSEKKEKHFYRAYDWYSIKRYPYWYRRFQCKKCRKVFSYSYFKLEYFQKRYGENHQIFNLINSGLSKRATGRMVHASECLVRARVQKMARWALLRHAELVEAAKIDEPLVYDGLENFSWSQYDPNHIQHMIGKNSLFTYDFGFAPLNRKGKMSRAQRMKKRFLESRYGAYPKKAIRTNTKAVFERVYEKCTQEPLVIHADQHFQYRRVVAKDLKALNIELITTPSKATRNFQNALFAVNHMDLLVRQNLAAFKRETIAFAKHPFGMIDQYVLQMIWKNTMRPMFTKPHKKDPRVNQRTPAMAIGLLKKRLAFHELFNFRRTPGQINLCEQWKQFYYRLNPYPARMDVLAYNGI